MSRDLWRCGYLRPAFRHSDLSHAAIDTNFAAVDEAGVVGGEKQRYRCDLFRASELLARDS